MSYVDKINAVTAHRQNLARLSDIFNSKAITGGERTSVGEYLKGLQDKEPIINDGLGTLVGAVAGGLVWKQHRVLGVIGGGSVGRNLPALFSNTSRDDALCNMGQTGAAVAGSLLLKNNSIAGFVLGWLVGGAVIHFGGFRK